ncbi:hypothetical protein U1Q18_028404 [Sarracenia purpurea var. burkii]
MASSSINNNSQKENANSGDVFCYCGLRVPIRTAITENNQEKMIYGLCQFQGGGYKRNKTLVWVVAVAQGRTKFLNGMLVMLLAI